ncbi:MAG TPA: hypothetical protein VGL94_22635 [Ktedonobacteraceae bacterium]|jgi:hypothetical protein
MELIYVIPADAAQAAPNGKFSLLGGGIENINALTFPTVQPGLALVVRLRVLPSEAEQDYKFSVHIIGPKDFRVISGDIAEFRPISSHGVSERPFAVNLILNMPLLVFPEPGTYRFCLYVDGQEVGTFPLDVQKIDNGEISSS